MNAAANDIGAHVSSQTAYTSKVQCDMAGKEYEERLRQQHVRLHPRTQWAARKRRRVVEATSDDEECGLLLATIWLPLLSPNI